MGGIHIDTYSRWCSVASKSCGGLQDCPIFAQPHGKENMRSPPFCKRCSVEAYLDLFPMGSTLDWYRDSTGTRYRDADRGDNALDFDPSHGGAFHAPSFPRA